MSDIILPNGEKTIKDQNGKEIDIDSFTNHDTYTTVINISCMDFLKSQGIQPGEQPNEKVLNFWASKMQEHYQLKATPEEVIMFFGMPEKYKDRIAQRQYSVREMIRGFEKELMVLDLQLKLTLNDVPYIPGVTDNIKSKV